MEHGFWSIPGASSSLVAIAALAGLVVLGVAIALMLTETGYVQLRGREPDPRKNYYEILGVPEGAGESDIREAYKSKVRELGPLANTADKDAIAELADVHEAYKILSDPERRACYEEKRKNPDLFIPAVTVVTAGGQVMPVYIIEEEQEPWGRVTEEDMQSEEVRAKVASETEEVRRENRKYIKIGAIFALMAAESIFGLSVIWCGTAPLLNKLVVSILPGLLLCVSLFIIKIMVWDGIKNLRNAEKIAWDKVKRRMETFRSMEWFLRTFHGWGFENGVPEDRGESEDVSGPLAEKGIRSFLGSSTAGTNYP
jgi:hypothetical protein